MKQLRIQSISELHFGKYHGSTFKDLDHDFVVFYGLNESGKSTIAEYLTWAIGGTWRKGTGVNLRFKTSTSEQVSGRLVGALGDETLDIDAKFKIQQTGVAKDLRYGTIGSRQIDNTKLKNSLRISSLRTFSGYTDCMELRSEMLTRPKTFLISSLNTSQETLK